MSEFWIKYLDPIESLMAPSLGLLLKESLSYEVVWYREGPFHKIRKDSLKSTLEKTKEGFLFYTGLWTKVQALCKEKSITLGGDEPPFWIKPNLTPNLPSGFQFRDWQKELIHTALCCERGLIKAPTGTGKTNLGIGILLHMANLNKALWLCHTKDLMDQTAKEASKFFGSENIGKVGDGNLCSNKFLTIATRQTFKKHVSELGTNYDVVIVDEGHHISKFNGDYSFILQRLYAPVRFALTATPPITSEAKMATEALIGPMIGEFTIKEAQKQDMLSTPKIKLVKVPETSSLKDYGLKYTDVYEKGIVRNLARNRLIADIVRRHHDKNESVLIVITKVAHGELLRNILKMKKINVEFVYGNTDSETRSTVKKALNEKRIKCVICSTIWKEGVDIPELNVVINAAGSKSEIPTMQVLGRGLRKTANKSELILYDFFDPSHRYLIDHFGHRVTLYMDNGWL